MRIIGFIIQKEFRQIFRNKAMLPIIFLLPVIQLLILANAATFEVKNIKLAIIDNDQSTLSRGLINKFRATEYFELISGPPTAKKGNNVLLNGTADVVLEIPRHFERRLIREKKTSLAVRIDAINGAVAGVESVYINQIIHNYNRSVFSYVTLNTPGNMAPVNIMSIPLYWFNETLNYKVFMVPGILVLLVTMIGLFLSGMNIVREKELGTLEQINVTPIKKHEFIIGKLTPFWILSLLILTVGLIISKFIFAVPIVGSIWLIYLFTGIYLLLILGMGFFISNFTNTQQQAMFIAWFFMVIFILMSGLFTPIESMPGWAQAITLFNPIRYFVEIIRMVMLKGSGFGDVLTQMLIILFYALLVNSLAVWTYRKTN